MSEQKESSAKRRQNNFSLLRTIVRDMILKKTEQTMDSDRKSPLYWRRGEMCAQTTFKNSAPSPLLLLDPHPKGRRRGG